MRATMVLVLLIGLAAALSMAQAPAPEAETSAAEQTVQVEVPLNIPQSEKTRVNPFPATDANVEFGIQIFASQCAMCHGTKGAGDGDLASSLGMKMPDFTDPAQQKKRTDGELYHILTKGHGRMPAEGERLAEDYRWKMVLAIRAMGH